MQEHIINGSTKVCGLLGNPVEHTMSPLVQNYLARVTGHNRVYIPLPVKADLEAAVKGAEAMGFLGCNVTVPYKSQVIPYLSEVDELAAQIGAVNTLVRTEQGWKGYNTDMPGLHRAMMEDGVEIAGEKIVILGAGGVARAVALLMARNEAKEIYLMNRTVEKAEAIAAEVNAKAGRPVVKAMALADYMELPSGKYLAIQATSVGMHPHTEEAVITEEAFYEKIHTGYDLIYNPADTKFMQLVKAHGGKAYNGLKMLLFQGIIAYELWNDTKITKEQAAGAYEVLAAGVERGVK